MKDDTSLDLGATKLGRLLVEAKLITEEQLRKATDFQKAVGGKLPAVIVKLGFITDDQVTQFIARRQNLRIAELDKVVLPENLIKRVPRELIEKHTCIPIAFRDGMLTLAVADPTDIEALEEIQLATDYKIEVALASRAALHKAINQFFYAEKPVEDKSKEQLLKELEESPLPKEIDERANREGVSRAQLQRALVRLLIEKRIISEDELIKKAKEIA
jgi:type IV pilus assembly protein PilB